MAKYDTSYYDEEIKKYTQNAQDSAKQQKAAIDAEAQSNLKKAYIAKLQSQNQLTDRLAQSGIRGGMTETANLNLQNAYNQNVATIGGQAQTSKTNIDTQTAQNVFDYGLQTNNARRQYVENREAEDRQRAMEIRTQGLTAKYSTSYDAKALKKKLKTVKDPEEKAIINARIGYIMQHKKKY